LTRGYLVDWTGIERAPAPAAAILAEITAGVAAGRDLSELLRRFLEPVMRIAGARGGAVRVLSQAGERLELVSEVGLAEEMRRAEASVDRHCGHCGVAADAAQVVWADDLSACRARTGVAAPCATSAQRMLAVPLQHKGRVLGVYNLFFAGGDAPAAEVQALLRSVGELLGLALHDARLEAENLRAALLHERQTWAAEVHDSIAQSLSFIRMRLPLLHDAWQAHDDAAIERYFDELRGAAGEAHASLRSVLAHLRAPMDPRGLVPALGASAEAFRRRSGAELEFVNDAPRLELAPEQEAQVFHIVQEALNNVARHAAAQHAWMRIAPAGAGRIEFVVEDDGTGLAGPGRTEGGSHYGLEIMQARARRLGGSLEVGPRPGGGTRVRLSLPAPGARGASAGAA
jgi:two-component system nitrate/nitrite sensor histidine kinase NarX